jgi:hypothetical protein
MSFLLVSVDCICHKKVAVTLTIGGHEYISGNKEKPVFEQNWQTVD